MKKIIIFLRPYMTHTETNYKFVHKIVNRQDFKKIIRINPIHDGWQKAPSPTSFPPVTLTNV